jgi:hypothetical protein
MEQVKQTAVEWLVDEFKSLGIYSSTLKEKCEQAKEMEKQQIINACYEGVDYETSIYENPEQYYNETYGGNK